MSRAADTRNPFRFRETWSGPLRGSLFGLAPDGVFRASSLALRAVRSYRTFSPLPASLAKRRRFDFLWHCPSESLSTFRPRVSPKAFGVTRHRALRCSDFPLPTRARSDSPPFQNHCKDKRSAGISQETKPCAKFTQNWSFFLLPSIGGSGMDFLAAFRG